MIRDDLPWGYRWCGTDGDYGICRDDSPCLVCERPAECGCGEDDCAGCRAACPLAHDHHRQLEPCDLCWLDRHAVAHALVAAAQALALIGWEVRS